MRKRRLCQLCVLWILFLLGMYCGKNDKYFDALKESKCEQLFSEGDTAYIVGKIYKKESGRIFLEEIVVHLENNHVAAEERLPVYLAEKNVSQLPMIGKTVLVKGIVKTIQSAPNPGNFNQKSYYQKQNIHIILREGVVIKVSGKSSVVKENMWQLRNGLATRIMSKTDEKYGGILCAMLLGETSNVNSDVKELFQKSGIGHLMAISGLHMSFIGMGLLEILKKAGVHKNLAIILSVIGLTFYLMLIDGGASSSRAYVMFLIRMGAMILGREYDGVTALSAAMIILLQNPLQLFDTGFLLSYGAILGIYVVAPRIEKSVGEKISVPVGLQLTLFPVILYSYYETCNYSVLWNLIAVPLSGIVLVTGILGTILNWTLPLKIAESILWFYHKGSIVVLDTPFSRWTVGQPEIAQIVFYYLFLIAAFWFLDNQKNVLRGMILLGAGMLVLWAPQQFSEKLEVTMLNVGQGDCFFLETSSGTTILIDGGSSSVTEVGKYRIEPFLKAQGVGCLDYVFVTHGDEDHVSGIRELLERRCVGISVKRLILPAQNVWDEAIEELARLAKRQGTAVYTMRQGEKMMIGEMELQCLWPSKSETESGNESSLVLAVSYKQFNALFTGDLEKESEAVVCEYIEKLQGKKGLSTDFEMLKVGHHGSKYATSEKMLDVLHINAAFISAGERNSYGHPHEEVLNRLANRSINLYNTKDGNAVKLCTDGEKYYILEP